MFNGYTCTFLQVVVSIISLLLILGLLYDEMWKIVLILILLTIIDQNHSKGNHIDIFLTLGIYHNHSYFINIGTSPFEIVK